MDIKEMNEQGGRFANVIQQVGKRMTWSDEETVAVLTSAFVNIVADMGGEVRAVEYLRDVADQFERQIMARM